MRIIDFFNKQTVGATELETIVGGQKQVNDFANFYETHTNEMASLALSSFLKWSENKEFDSKEQKAFMDGIALGLGFFANCANIKKDLKETENK